MILARLRPNGDYKRSEIQNLIMGAIAEKLFNPFTLASLAPFFEIVHNSTQTDIGPLQAGQLTCLATKLDAAQIEFFSFPEDLFKSARVQDPVLGNTSILEADFEVLKKYVEEFEDGTWGE
jgi:anionic cell wall polymer biosynthesis LytR-Cps2A-Psr (LCP) family protein